jgi:hypothetical protein
MSSDIRRFINSIPSNRTALALQNALDRMLPVGKDTAVTAGSTQTQAGATVLRDDCSFHNVTTVATASDGVALPYPKIGMAHYVKNSVAANAMKVYAATPGTIDSTATATGVTQLAGDGVLYWCMVDGDYLRLGGVSATEVFGAITATNITSSEPNVYDSATTITAFATGGQGSATALTAEFNNVTTCATAGDSVKLPTAVAGLKITVKNSGATSLAVFPFSGDSINALAVNLSVNIPVGGTTEFRAISGTVWETQEALVLSAPTTQRGELVIKSADNAADHEIVVINASHGQATTHTVPDPGAAAASFVLTEGAQTINGAKTVTDLSSFATAVEAAEHGAGAIGTSSFGAPKTYRWIENGVIVTQTKFDLTGLASGGTANDIVGLAAGGAAYIGRNVVATNGVIFKMELSCLETPVTGDGDIDIIADTSAALIGDGTYTGAIKINGGTLVIGQTVQNLVPAVDANFYFYIAAVGAGGGTYTAGMFVLTTYGHAVLA